MRSYPDIDPRAVWGVILTTYRSNNPVMRVTHPKSADHGLTSEESYYGEPAVLTHKGHDIETGWSKEEYFITALDVAENTILGIGEAKSLLYEMSKEGILIMHKHGDENDGTPLFLPAPVDSRDILVSLVSLEQRMEENR